MLKRNQSCASQIGSVYVVSSGMDLTDFGWVGVGVLDGIKAISAQLGLGFGLSLEKENLS